MLRLWITPCSNHVQAEEIFEVGGVKALSIYQAWVEQLPKPEAPAAEVEVTLPTTFNQEDCKFVVKPRADLFAVVDDSDGLLTTGDAAVGPFVTSTPRKEAPGRETSELSLPVGNDTQYLSASDSEKTDEAEEDGHVTPVNASSSPIAERRQIMPESPCTPEQPITATTVEPTTPTPLPKTQDDEASQPGTAFHTPFSRRPSEAESSPVCAQDLRLALDAVAEKEDSDMADAFTPLDEPAKSSMSTPVLNRKELPQVMLMYSCCD